jgi:hypothetical protein
MNIVCGDDLRLGQFGVNLTLLNEDEKRCNIVAAGK